MFQLSMRYSSYFIFSSLAFTAGIACLWLLPRLFAINFILLWLVIIVIYLIICRKFPILFIIGTTLFGFLYGYYFSQNIIQQRIPSQLESIPLQITGKIISIPENNQDGIHFEFLLEKISALHSHSSWKLPQKIRLNWSHYKIGSQNTLKVGETWQLTVKLKAPRSTYNPASFDYEAWLFSHRISATGSVIEAYKIATPFWKNPIDNWREIIQNKIENTLGDNTNLGMIESLSIGSRANLTSIQWKIMQATGTNHLVAIAGLHIGYVVFFVYFLSKLLIRRIPFLLLWTPAHELALIISLIAAIYYSALSGFSLPTQRALIMLSIALFAQILHRTLSIGHSFAIALFAVLFYDPLCIFSESFWLSFIAVGIIIFSITGRLGKLSHWQELLKLQWIITIGLAPITLYFFHQMSLTNLLANAIAIPWIACLTLPIILLAIFILPLNNFLANQLLHLAAQSLDYYWPTLNWLAGFDRLQWQTYIPYLYQLIFAIMGCLIFLAPRGIPFKYLGLCGFFPLLFFAPPKLQTGEFFITQLDVGQGLSTLIQTKNHILIFDTGPRLGENYDMANSVILPTLLLKKIYHIDVLLLSHADNDHSGGAPTLFNGIAISNILTSVPENYQNLPTTLPTNLKVMACETGQIWHWDNVEFEILNPDSGYNPQKGNDSSCVLRIHNRYHSILLTGDIELPTEKKLWQEFSPQILKTEILLAPHHGSKSSSSYNFIEAVHPHWVIYATGYHNKFGFPHDEVVSRYHFINAIALDTATSGQIEIDAPDFPGALRPIATRIADRHFWNF